MANNEYNQTYLPEHYKAHKNGVVYEHVLIAEEVLGRKLKPNEVVHHIDEDKRNNSIENIMVFRSNSDHIRFHKRGKLKLMSDGTYISPLTLYKITCKTCEKKSLSRYRGRKFCSTKCSYENQRVTIKPSKDELDKLIRENSFVSIGNMFNVSDNNVRKWCKSYGLPFRKKDLKRADIV